MQQALDDVNLPLLTFLMAAGGVGASHCYPHESMVKISAELLAQLLDAGIVNVNARDPTHGTFVLHRVRARMQMSLLLRKNACKCHSFCGRWRSGRCGKTGTA